MIVLFILGDVMIFTEKVDIYLVNLERSKDRLAVMESRLNRFKFPFMRIEAVDGVKETFSNDLINYNKYRYAHGKNPVLAEIGCYQSHIKVMNYFLTHSEKPYALILEDDVDFEPTFLDAVESLLEVDDFDVVRLSGKHGGGKFPKRQLASPYKMMYNFFFQNHSGSYIISRKAAKNYTQKMNPMFVPYDHELGKYWKYDLRGFSISPFPVYEVKKDSTISLSVIKKNRLKGVKKMPRLFYRLYVHIYRFISTFMICVQDKLLRR